MKDTVGPDRPGQDGRELVRRTAVLDEYVEDGESVVFVGGRLLVLSGLATTALASLGERELTPRALGDALAAVHGEPPDRDRDEVVGAVIDQLEGLGLVTVERDPRST